MDYYDYIEEVFKLLEIEPTRDKLAIKKAYARQVKKYHPEEAPEEWTKIHNAYKSALSYAAAGDTDRSFRERVPEISGSDTEYSHQETSRQESFHQEDFKQEQGEDYSNLFQGTLEQETERYEKAVRGCLKKLEGFLHVPEVHGSEGLRGFLESADFLVACEDETVLNYMQFVFSRIQISKEATELLLQVLDDLKQRLLSSMQSYKVTQVEGIQTGLRGQMVWETVPTKTLAEKKEKQKKVEKKRSWLHAAAAIGMIIVAFAVVVFIGYINNPRRGLSKSEAEDAAVKYLNEKYTDMKYEPGDLVLETYHSLSVRDVAGTKSKDYGYRGYLSENPQKGILVLSQGGEGEDNQEVICLDNFQKGAIVSSMKEEMVLATGIAEEMLAVSSGCTNIEDGVFHDYGSYFHTFYEGDLKNFLDMEAECKTKALGWYGEETMNANGKCVIYFRDPAVTTITERLANTELQSAAKAVSVLEDKAAEYQMQMEGVFLVQEYYDEVQAKAQEDSYMEEHILADAGGLEEDEPPLLGAGVTAWYLSECQTNEACLQTQQIEQAADGIYVMNQEGEDTRKEDATDSVMSADLQSIFDTLPVGACTVEKTEIPNEMEEALGKEGIIPEKTWNYRVGTEHSGKKVLILDKQALGIEEGRVAVAYEEAAEGMDEDISVLTKVSGVEEHQYLYENMVDEFGYLFLYFYAMGYTDDIISVIR